MEQNELLTQNLEDINRAIEISYDTLSTISRQRDDETISWTVAGVMEQLEKIKEYSSNIYKILTESEDDDQ